MCSVMGDEYSSRQLGAIMTLTTFVFGLLVRWLSVCVCERERETEKEKKKSYELLGKKGLKNGPIVHGQTP